MGSPAEIVYEVWRSETDPVKLDPWICLSHSEQQVWSAVVDALEEFNPADMCNNCGENPNE